MPSDSRIVYNNESLGTQISCETASNRTAKPKSNSLKCSNCAWSTFKARKHPNVVYTMKRFYIKEKRSWKAKGWYCPRCGSICLDELTKQIRSPEPKLFVASTKQ